jgi:hypothetical protein
MLLDRGLPLLTAPQPNFIYDFMLCTSLLYSMLLHDILLL